MALAVLLSCVGVLLAAGVAAVAGARSERDHARRLLDRRSSSARLHWPPPAAVLVTHPDAVATVQLPIGLPWLGAHFRLDCLSALFLVVVNLGGLTASLYGLGYGPHETAPGRVLPFFPVFLAGMNLVVLADDAFTFLLTWEFMSLSSWALVMAHHRKATTPGRATSTC